MAAKEISEEIEGLIADGKKAYGLKEYEEAVDNFSQACQLYAEEHGEDDPDLLFKYGIALYHVGIENSDVLGAKVSDNDNESSGINKNKLIPDRVLRATSAAGNAEHPKHPGLFHFEGDLEEEETIKDQEAQDKSNGAQNDESNGNQNEENKQEKEAEEQEEEEEESELESAWTILDLARSKFERQIEELSDQGKGKDSSASDEQINNLKRKLAETYDILGEVSLESENFKQASQDLSMALKLKEDLYPVDSEVMSEAHYKLALAFEFCSDIEGHREKAAEEIRKVIERVKSRQAGREGSKDSDLLHDLKLRLADLEAPVRPPTPPITSQSLQNALAGDDNAKKQLLQSIVGNAPVNDLSTLIRKKKPTEDNSSNAKRKAADSDAPSERSTKKKD